MKGKRRIVHEFEIEETSSVDMPAQEHALARIMKRGREAPQKGAPDMSFMEKVEQIRRVDECGRLAAMQKARRLYPQAFEAYRTLEIEKAAAPPPREDSFMATVDRLRAEQPGLSRCAAMQKARRLYPQAFEAYRTPDVEAAA